MLCTVFSFQLLFKRTTSPASFVEVDRITQHRPFEIARAQHVIFEHFKRKDDDGAPTFPQCDSEWLAFQTFPYHSKLIEF